MQFGLSTLTSGVFTTREAYMAVAKAAERAGFDFLSVSDHVVVPANLQTHYPYRVGGAFTATEQGYCFDQLATIAFLAGCTERLRLLTSVLVVPHRPAVLTAKMLATIDILCSGRLIVGCGVGWLREEFEALGAPPYAERGRATDEYLDAFKRLWTEDAPKLRGTHVSFDNIIFSPKPVTKPHPPIWIGGESPQALKRAVRVGDGWYPASNNPQHRLDTAERLTKGVGELRRLAEAAGRDPATIDVGYVLLWPVDWTAQTTAEGARRLFTGRPADMAEDVAALGRAGVRHVCLTFQTPSLPETLERMQRFAAEVLPLAR